MDLNNSEAAPRQSLLSHFVTAENAAPYMIRKHRGLIVEVTEGDAPGAGGDPVTQIYDHVRLPNRERLGLLQIGETRAL
jgi:hypothetical protein